MPVVVVVGMSCELVPGEYYHYYYYYYYYYKDSPSIDDLVPPIESLLKEWVINLKHLETTTGPPLSLGEETF